VNDELLTTALWVGLGLAALALPRHGRRGWVCVRRAAQWLGAHASAWILLCALLGVGLPMFGAYVIRWPQPGIHDEFAYLLMAETFVDGRCAMPTHPFWQHFEAFHVFHQPTYAAKYPPAMGLPLAVGIALFDEPRVGLWLQSGLLAASFAWMLFGWLPRRWAVVGSLLGVLRFCASGLWVQTFYYSALAGIGGALVLGVLGRVLRAQPSGAAGATGQARPVRVVHGVLLALGLGILANTRPFEGLVLSLPVALVLGVWLVRRVQRRELAPVARLVVPTTLVLLAIGAATLRYNYAVTGSATTMPYFVDDEQYAVYPQFLFQPMRPEPQFRHADMREFAFGFQSGSYGAWGDARAMAALAWERLLFLAREFVGWSLCLPLVLGLLRPRRRSVAMAVGVGGSTFLALLTTTYIDARYPAPVVSALLLLVTLGLRNFHLVPVVGRRFGAALALALCLAASGTYVQKLLQWRPPPIAWFGRLRVEVQARLDAEPGRDLVFVRCVEGHIPHHCWVVNGARIDDQEIVWARDMGPERNRALIDYYPRRVIWRLTSGDLLRDGPQLAPYDAAE